MVRSFHKYGNNQTIENVIKILTLMHPVEEWQKHWNGNDGTSET